MLKIMGHKLTVSSGTIAYLSDGDTQVFPVEGKQKNKWKDPKIATKTFQVTRKKLKRKKEHRQ